MKIRFILLDYDDTMARTEVLALGRAYDLLVEVLRDHYGLSVNHSKEHHIDKFAGTTFREILLQLGPQLGFEVEEEDMNRFVRREVEAVLEVLGNSLTPMPGSIEMLESLQAAGIVSTVVSSSATKRLQACLNCTGQNKFIADHLIFSASDSMPTSISKPDPAIYKFALAEIGVGADEVVAVEDSLSGVKSAVGAGISCIGFTGAIVDPERKAIRHQQLAEVGAFMVVDDLREIMGVIQGA